MNCVSQSWASNEPMGIMCVDFSKAFDSVEHQAVKMILEFFNFGPRMVNGNDSFKWEESKGYNG